MYVLAPPKSRVEIEQHAIDIRHLLRVDDTYQPDMADLPEYRLRDFGVAFGIESHEYMGDIEGETRPDSYEILLREDVYNALCKHEARARFTMAHELGHLILHR